MTPRKLAGTALGMSAILGLASTAAMMLFGRAFYAALGATGPALEAAVLYSDMLFLGAVPFWLFNAAASVLRGGGNTAYPAAAGAAGGVVTLAVSPLVIFGAGPVPGLGIAGAAWAVVAYNVAMAAVLLRAVWASGSPTRPGFAFARAAVALRLRDPPRRGAECGQHAGDQPHVHHPDGPGRAVRGGGDRRVRCRGASGVPADPHRFRRRLGAGSPGCRQRRGGGLRPRPQADPRRRGAGRGGVRAGGRHRRPVPVGVDGAVHLGPRGGGVRQGVPGPGRPGLRLPRAGAGPVFRRAGAWADGAAAAGHPDPAAGRRGAGRPGAGRLRLGDRLPVRPDGLRPRACTGWSWSP